MLIRLPRLLFFWNLIILITLVGIAPVLAHSQLNDLLRAAVTLTGVGAALWILAAEIWHHLTH